VAFGVKVEASKRIMEREKFFRADEIRSILRLARSATIDRKFPRASASRRWVPWICAYSGARVQEPLWLKRDDVRTEAGIPVLCFSRTKDGWPRMVPIHQALIDEGLLDFVSSAPSGWLFVGDTPQRTGASRTQQEMRAAELTHWVRRKVGLDEGLSPSHAWRHTFITYAENRIAKRFLNRITGHNMEDVSGRYVGALVTALATEMAKFPRYEV
jgi:integrase